MLKRLVYLLTLGSLLGVCWVLGGCVHPASHLDGPSSGKSGKQPKSAASELPKFLRDRRDAVGRIDRNCGGFHIGGGLVVTAASCLLGDLTTYESCRTAACKRQPGAPFCSDSLTKKVVKKGGVDGEALEEMNYQSNIPPECYVKRCRAEFDHDLPVADQQASKKDVGRSGQMPMTIRWPHGISICQAIMAASYAPGKLDYAVIIVENPPAVNLELDYEFNPSYGAQVDYFGYRSDLENRDLALIRGNAIVESPDRKAQSSQLFCYAHDNKELTGGSPLLDPTSSFVVGIHGLGGSGRCAQSSATVMKPLKKIFAIFPGAGMPEEEGE